MNGGGLILSGSEYLEDGGRCWWVFFGWWWVVVGTFGS